MKQFFGKLLIICMTLSLFLGGRFALGVEAAEEDRLNFLVVESVCLEMPGEQKVAVSIGDGETEITEAVLHYTNRETGEVYEEQADRIVDDALLFTMKFEQEDQIGIYELSSIDYMTAGEKREIALQSLGKEVVFGVNREVEEASENTMEAQIEVPEEIAVVDEQGETVSELSIAEALEKASDSVAGQAGLYRAGSGKFVVALDPGHGGSDPGVQRIFGGVTYSERDLVLKIANFCKEELEKNGIEVVLTRTDNHSTLMNRKERTDYAVERGASIIVSLHLNSTSATNGTASGSLVFVPNKNTDSRKLSNQLAAEILSKLELLGLKNRGTTVDEELGMILYPKQYGIPGILVEHAFLNNANDVANYLNSDAKLKKIGIADAQGIMEYMKNNSINFNSGTVYEGRDYKDVFDAEYYAGHYADLKKVYGNDASKLLRHFVLQGMKEGRQGNEEFNVRIYRDNYADLRKAYGDDLEKYYRHYQIAGKAEGRNGKTSLTAPKPEKPNETPNVSTTVYEGKEYKDVFNADYYANHYADLKKVYGNDASKLLRHFVLQGMKEGRQGNEEFNVRIYRDNYADLRKAYGDDLEKYYRHYQVSGKTEGRNGKTSLTAPKPEKPNETPDATVTVYEGVDYKNVFNAEYYGNKYEDLRKVYGNDAERLLRHFVLQGMKEGRQASAEFNVWSYRGRYEDLKNAFGDNLEKYYWHYRLVGKSEGRIAN